MNVDRYEVRFVVAGEKIVLSFADEYEMNDFLESVEDGCDEIHVVKVCRYKPDELEKIGG